MALQNSYKTIEKDGYTSHHLIEKRENVWQCIYLLTLVQKCPFIGQHLKYSTGILSFSSAQCRTSMVGLTYIQQYLVGISTRIRRRVLHLLTITKI